MSLGNASGNPLSGMWYDESVFCSFARRLERSMALSSVCICIDFVCDRVCIPKIHSAERRQEYDQMVDRDWPCDDTLLRISDDSILSYRSAYGILLWQCSLPNDSNNTINNKEKESYFGDSFSCLVSMIS